MPEQPGRFASIKGMSLDPKGGFVTFTEYEKLQAHVAELETENATLKQTLATERLREAERHDW